MRSRLGAPMVPVAGGVLLDKEDAGERRTAAVEDAGATGKSRPTRKWVALDRILMWVDSGVGEVLGAGDEVRELLQSGSRDGRAALGLGSVGERLMLLQELLEAAVVAGSQLQLVELLLQLLKLLQALESLQPKLEWPLQKLESAAGAGIAAAEAGSGCRSWNRRCRSWNGHCRLLEATAACWKGRCSLLEWAAAAGITAAVAGTPKDASRHRSQLVKPGALSEPEVIVSSSGRVKNHRSRSGRRLKVAMRSGEVSWEGCPRDKSAVSRAPIPPCSEVTVPCAVMGTGWSNSTPK
ncbi:hypothetical protein MLD38_010010 [Melastoma candidum]|uniref:Uncharacterized protein n=1 Tax=Melastoma candidum TaxID=119954 RepID=A0ACB9QXP9_9MYRT|nr:hypothetical protein MLD38_010010 [Melastoma candidum]